MVGGVGIPGGYGAVDPYRTVNPVAGCAAADVSDHGGHAESRTQAAKKLAQALRWRAPESEEPLDPKGVPSEVRPLVESLNQLFTRIHSMMVRERRFTSDAAHELRSPLTALKVQTEVVQLSDDDPQTREKALVQLHAGIERATRLVDQLLTLSRLDSLDNLQDVAEISLEELLQSAVMDIYHPAQQAHIDVRLQINAHNITRTGQPLLLSLMVRNLLDNAIRYSPQGSIVEVTLNARNFSVKDNGLALRQRYLHTSVNAFIVHRDKA